MTAAIIEVVARRLLGKPNAALSTKTELRYGAKGSLSIDLRKSVWNDFEEGEGGGVLDLVVRERGGIRRDAARWLEGDSRVLGNRSAPTSYDRITAKLEKKQEEEEEDKRRRKEAIEIWDTSTPAQHTPTEEYLRCRGIVIQPPSCLRYHPGINALVALVQAPDGTFSGIQRIYLKTDSRGTWATGKFSLAAIKGGAVRLTPAASTLQLTESVEDGMALLQMTGKPTWAVPGAGFMVSFEPPPEVREIVLAPDHDKAGLEAIEKGRVKPRGAARIRRLLPPPGKDWCDVLEDQEERTAIIEEPELPPTWAEEFVSG